MTDLRPAGATDFRDVGGTDLRAPGATDLRAAGGGTLRREGGGGATDGRTLLAFADDLGFFLGMAAACKAAHLGGYAPNPEAYYTCESFPNFDELRP
jgi:hypothetical protein